MTKGPNFVQEVMILLSEGEEHFFMRVHICSFDMVMVMMFDVMMVSLASNDTLRVFLPINWSPMCRYIPSKNFVLTSIRCR